MGKKQHSKDQLYITQTEWKADWGGHKANANVPYKVLPFDCCAISLRPFEAAPVCAPDGVVFDLLNLLPFLKKYKRHPVSGAPLSAAELTKLNFHKNAEGKYHCPVLFKVFNNHSHIVVVRPTGHVYSYEAVKELNLKAKNMHDLLDSTPFTRDDIITIQDPSDGSRREIERFAHITEKLHAKPESSNDSIRANDATARVLEQLKAKRTSSSGSTAQSSAAKETARTGAAAARTGSAGASSASTPAPRWLQTTGKHSAGFTSTTLDPVTSNEIAALSAEEAARQRYAFLKTKKQKAYAQLQTTHGNLNLEIHVDLVPKTCENFITLAERGYYTNVAFHRLVRNFMIQGGDPSGTGNGGESIWGAPFADEFSSKLKHDGRGVLSMANSGPNTNKSQFFITFKSAAHLDGKHAVFGRVVGGFDTLSAFEKVPTDSDDRPTQHVAITGVAVIVNPFDKVEEEMAAAHAREADPEAARAHDAAKRLAEDSQAWYNVPIAQPEPVRQGIGKYIKLEGGASAAAASTAAASAAAAAAALAEEPPPPKKAKRQGGGFGDFSSW